MHTMVYIYNETWSKLGGYALVRLDVCVLWSGLLVGKWHFSIYLLLEDNRWSTMVFKLLLLFFLISHFENLEPFEYLKIRLVF